MGAVLRATRKLAALSLLDAQNALLLLSGCLSTALTYHLQVTPPRLAAAAAQAWDDAMDAARARIMSEPSVGVVPVVGPALQALSDGKARLPLKKGGLGHTSAAMLSPAAFYATYTQHAFHEQVGPDRMLVQELDFARALLTPSLPQAALELLADPCVMRLKAPPVKLQRSITQALQTRAHAALMDSAPDDRDKRIIFCAFTSLGGLSEPVVKFLNGAAGFLKACETAAALRRLRDDGLTPQLLSKRFRFRARALLQAAILQGNGSIAYSVGL
jgi:hypothetical protein